MAKPNKRKLRKKAKPQTKRKDRPRIRYIDSARMGDDVMSCNTGTRDGLVEVMVNLASREVVLPAGGVQLLFSDKAISHLIENCAREREKIRSDARLGMKPALPPEAIKRLLAKQESERASKRKEEIAALRVLRAKYPKEAT
jgi:hypothetical protein